MKKKLSLFLCTTTLLAALSGCSSPVKESVGNVLSSSSAMSVYADWLEDRLTDDGRLTDDTEIIIGNSDTAQSYGVDTSTLSDEGFIIRRTAGENATLIFANTNDGVDRGVRYFANYCSDEGELNVVEGEGYRVGSITIAGADLSEYVIVCPSDADECQKFAADELRRFLGDACGIYPDIVTESVGYAITLMRDVTGETYGDEAFNIKSHEKGITITGGRYRGCMYGVYDFLEECIGYRFYYEDLDTDGAGKDVGAASAYLYKSESVEVANVDYSEFPSIHARDAHGDGTSSVALKFNGMRQGGSKYGGYGVITKACHGYSQWIPDWELQDMGYNVGYAYGKQPCFSDEYLNELLIERILSHCRSVASRGGDPGTIDVAQHDIGEFCMCSGCIKVYSETGGRSGAVVRLANMVAEALEPEFPDTPVAILAYYGTDVAPKKIAIHKNVYVSYCFYVTLPADGYMVCGNHSINGTECSTNKYFADRYNEWAALTDNLYVWYYPFQAYHLAYSSTYTNNIYHDIKYLAECGTYGIFFHANGASQTYGPLLIDFYMGERMMWDATITEEEYHEMLKEFLWLAYGDGGDAVYEYMQLLEKAADHKGCFCGFHSTMPDKLNFSYIKENIDLIMELRDTAIRYARNSLQEELCNKLFKSALYYRLVVSHTDMWKNGTEETRAEYKVMVDDFLTNHRDLPLGEYGLGSPAYPPTLAEVNYDDNPLAWIYDMRGSWNGNDYEF